MNLALLARLMKAKRREPMRSLAKKIGVSYPTISRIENGKTPTLEVFERLCDWLEVDPRLFFDRYTPPSVGFQSGSFLKRLYAERLADARKEGDSESQENDVGD